jgi:predicted GNAT superfamily acetyltransferase
MGLDRMTWTFDPLQAKNAHFNLAKLGVVSGVYKEDFYGASTTSALHQNGTDRLWVEWGLESKRVLERLQNRNAPTASTLEENSVWLVESDERGRPIRLELQGALASPQVLIRIPASIDAIQQQDPVVAHEWRDATRWALTSAFETGFLVVDFRVQKSGGAYVLTKGSVEELSAKEVMPAQKE